MWAGLVREESVIRLRPPPAPSSSSYLPLYPLHTLRFARTSLPPFHPFHSYHPHGPTLPSDWPRCEPRWAGVDWFNKAVHVRQGWQYRIP